MKTYAPGQRIGILGGGQLARMLAHAAQNLGFEVRIFCQSPDEPAAQAVASTTIAETSDNSALNQFLQSVDFVTFESEFIDVVWLQNAAHNTNCAIFPHPQTMSILQDRLTQKQVLCEHDLPTLPFSPIENRDQALQFLKVHRDGIVMKTRRNGYDGYGTFIAKNAAKLKQHFASWGTQVPPLIAEPLCPFRRELAITLVRNGSGDIVSLPLVQSFQENSRCKWVKGPINHKKLNGLKKKLMNFLDQIDYVGAIAFELFDTGKDLLINEIAPRVHNSAHYSQNALSIDQFELHVLAITDQRLPKVVLQSKGFAMVNLLGRNSTVAALTAADDVHLHWYGKKQNRPGRKMGHLNANGSSADQALRKALLAERNFRL